MLPDQPGQPLRQGYIIAWTRHGYRWHGLVAIADDGPDQPQLVQQRLPADRLRAVRVDPNRRPLDGWH